MTPTVTAVIPAFGNEPWLESAARAVLSSDGVDVSLIVVDNGCTSDAVDRVKGLDRVQVITPDTNTGYTGGCNRGALEAAGEFLALVNSDAIAAPDALARLVAVASEPQVGFAMGSIRLADSPELLNTAGNPLHFTGLSWAGGFGEPAERHAQRATVPVGSGCFMVMRRDVWEHMGGFAEEYFAYCEDADLSLRLWQQGRTVEYVPDAVVLHHYEFSRNETKFYFLERNRLALVLTTYQRRTLVVLATALLLTEVLTMGVALLGGWARAKLRGWAWLWRHRAWIASRRAAVQAARTVPDSVVLRRATARLDPANVAAPAGTALFSALMQMYWSAARRFL